MICIFLCLLNCMFGITVYAAETWSSGTITKGTSNTDFLFKIEDGGALVKGDSSGSW